MTPHAHLCFHLFGNTVQEHVHDFDNGDGVYDDMERVIEWAERWQIKFNNMKWGVLNFLVGWEEDV